MGWFSGETEQQRQQREWAEQRQAEQERQARANAEFAASPRGQARAAAERGDTWLRLELRIWRSTQCRGFLGGVDSERHTVTDQAAYAQTVTDVSGEGWQLFSTSSAFVPDQVDSNSNGGAVAVSGDLVDVLVFQRAFSEPTAPPAPLAV